MKLIGRSLSLQGQEKRISPPPPGGAPRLRIFNSRPSSEPEGYGSMRAHQDYRRKKKKKLKEEQKMKKRKEEE